MAIDIYRPPFYQPRLPIGGGGGVINIPAPQKAFGETGLTDIAKILTGAFEKKRQRELDERKLSMEEEYRRAQIGSLKQDAKSPEDTLREQLERLYKLKLYQTPPGSVEEQVTQQAIDAITAKLADLAGQTIETTPATEGTPASGQFNPFKPNVAAVPATPETKRLVPQKDSPTPVPPGLESIIGSTFKEKPQKAADKEKPEKTAKTDEPTSEQNFIDKVARLKATDMKAAKAYYDKWIKKWQ